MIQFLHHISDQPVGGKARGLKVLKELGLRVPDSFIIIHPNGSQIPEEKLSMHLKMLGDGPKAVRSSAVSEDGFHASFAGQFETFLNVSGPDEVREAIRKCIEAAYSDRVASYSENIHHKADTRISVIIQNMVQAEKAGVIFTADPVSSRRDKMVIDVVAGSGDELVSGRKDAVHYELFRSGKNIPSQLKKQGYILSPDQVTELMSGAKKAEREYGCPVDLEWAIDGSGMIYWLQVRPITTLDDVHYNELDDVKGESTDVWSLGNICEMMPGVVTPLTYSVSGRTIGLGLGYLAAKSGVIPMKDFKTFRSLELFYNRLFFNMSKYMIYVEKLAMNKKENIIVSLSAKDVQELGDPERGPVIPGFLRFLKQNYNLMRAHRHVKRMALLAKDFKLPMTGDLEADYKTLCYGFDKLTEAFCHHNMSSAQSGYYYSVLMGILTKNKRPASPQDHYLYSLLVSHTDGIESADAVKSIEKFTGLVREHPEFAEPFAEASPEKALELIEKQAPELIRNRYHAFLERHGHRCVRESELREKPWEEDQVQLVSMIQASLKAGSRATSGENTQEELTRMMSELNTFQRLFIRLFKNPTRKAVAGREQTKAGSMKMIHELRKAWRRHAESLVSAGLLDDPDQVFFLTQEEHGKLIADKSPLWKEKARKRRILLPETAKLQFDLMNPGIPEPIEEEEPVVLSGDQLRGIPVSSGIAEGVARVVNSLEEATLLRKGEIMVVSFTDIGWTPYFSLISGLVTEIGSPLSHGAVVAREYGIPAVVSVKGARSFIQTGDLIRVNGSSGVIETLTS